MCQGPTESTAGPTAAPQAPAESAGGAGRARLDLPRPPPAPLGRPGRPRPLGWQTDRPRPLQTTAPLGPRGQLPEPAVTQFPPPHCLVRNVGAVPAATRSRQIRCPLGADRVGHPSFGALPGGVRWQPAGALSPLHLLRPGSRRGSRGAASEGSRGGCSPAAVTEGGGRSPAPAQTRFGASAHGGLLLGVAWVQLSLQAALDQRDLRLPTSPRPCPQGGPRGLCGENRVIRSPMRSPCFRVALTQVTSAHVRERQGTSDTRRGEPWAGRPSQPRAEPAPDSRAPELIDRGPLFETRRWRLVKEPGEPAVASSAHRVFILSFLPPETS